MLTKQEILELAKKTVKKQKLNIKIEFLQYNKFKEIAKKSPLVKKVLNEGNDFYDLNIPSLFSHKNNKIYFSEKILQKLLHNEPLSIQKRFILAITYHEIFHFINKHKMKDKSLNSSLLSEENASEEFKRNFPSLAALGRRISKKYINE